MCVCVVRVYVCVCVGEHVKCAEEPEGGADVLERGRDAPARCFFMCMFYDSCALRRHSPRGAT